MGNIMLVLKLKVIKIMMERKNIQ